MTSSIFILHILVTQRHGCEGTPFSLIHTALSFLWHRTPQHCVRLLCECAQPSALVRHPNPAASPWSCCVQEASWNRSGPRLRAVRRKMRHLWQVPPCHRIARSVRVWLGICRERGVVGVAWPSASYQRVRIFGDPSLSPPLSVSHSLFLCPQFCLSFSVSHLWFQFLSRSFASLCVSYSQIQFCQPQDARACMWRMQLWYQCRTLCDLRRTWRRWCLLLQELHSTGEGPGWMPQDY